MFFNSGIFKTSSLVLLFGILEEFYLVFLSSSVELFCVALSLATGVSRVLFSIFKTCFSVVLIPASAVVISN